MGSDTVQAHLLPAAQGLLGDPAYFCPTDSCPVAYYDLWERSIPAEEACGLFWPKDPAGPLCACHGLTCDDVDLDIADIARAGTGRDLAKVVDGEHQDTSCDRRRGTSASRSDSRAFTARPHAAT